MKSMVESLRDVIVVGGGPAGSCAANLLAQAGADVVLLERARFPRFHIGESMLPTSLAIIERLGVDLDTVPFLRKYGASFLDERTGRSARFSFDEALGGSPDHAFQVDRATFDHELLRAAGQAGAELREGHQVLSARLPASSDEDRVVVSVRELDTGREFDIAARYLIDASGQKALLARQNRSIKPYREFGRAAVFRHYQGLAPEINAELHESGDIVLKVMDDGWMWIIPLMTGDLSVGLVKTKGKVEAKLLDAAVADSPHLRRLTAGSTPGPVSMIGNFSYRNTAAKGPRYACVGDAACFLDPVFSSGVGLALLGAERLADLLAPALASGEEAAAELMDPLSTHMERAYDAFYRFIYRFYNTRLLDNVLLLERKSGHPLRSGVISLLAADVWREDNMFQNMLMRSDRSHSS